MLKIKINNNKHLSIETNDYDVLNRIGNEFSYKPVGIEYSPAYKNGWNGIIHLLTQKNGKNMLPLGLLYKLQDFLRKIDYESVLQDSRPDLVLAPELDIGPRLASLNITLRDYQERIVETAFKNRKGIIRAATGAGKSLCIASLAARVNKPIIIGVIGIDLLDQFHSTLSKLFDEKIGYIGNGVLNIQRINVASVWTLGRSLGIKKDIIDDDSSEKEIIRAEHVQSIIHLLKTTKVFIFDECHVVGTETIRQIYKVIDPELIFGFSGTPYRNDGSDLLSEGLLGPQIINISASELIEKGYLAQPFIKFVPVNKIYSGAKDYPGIYRDCIVENKERNELIIQNTKMLLDKGYKTLILFKQIKHGKILQEMFNDNNIEIEMLYGNDSIEKRNDVKSKIQEGKLKAVLASTIFDIGVDLPALSALVLTGSGRSPIKSLQRIGRILRPFDGKKTAAVIDYFDDAKYLKQHSKARYETYKSEPGFVVNWPKLK